MTQSVRLYVYLKEKRVCMFKRVLYVYDEERKRGQRQREGQVRPGEPEEERRGEGRVGEGRGC
jgi:hypothetical protein